MNKFLTLIILTIISLNLFTPIYAVEQGVQIPSSNELSGLSSTPFQYQWIKFQYSWGSDQPIEQWVSNAKQAGYKVLVSVAKKPPSVPGGEAGYQQFGTFMQELSARLGNNVDAYEIWNEPNLNDEWSVWGQINPAEYIKLLQAGTAGVKQGNPSATVVTAALAPLSGDYDDEKYFNEFVTLGGLNIPGVDAIGWHSNVTSNIPPTDSTLQGFQRVKIALGHGKPVWITEFGWDRNSAQINRQTQLQYISQAFQIGSQLGGIDTMIIWNYGFGKSNPLFAPWDIGLNTATNGGQLNDTGDSGCEGLLPEECALKLTSISTVPDNISKGITLEKPAPANTVQQLINSFLGFLGFKVNNPQTYSSRSDVQVKTAIPNTAQSEASNEGQQTSQNIGFNVEKAEKSKIPDLNPKQQGVGIYQYMLPKEVANSFVTGESLGFTCGYENAQYPVGVRPINGVDSNARCNDALGIK